jgi:hypothetical protein
LAHIWTTFIVILPAGAGGLGDDNWDHAKCPIDFTEMIAAQLTSGDAIIAAAITCITNRRATSARGLVGVTVLLSFFSTSVITVLQENGTWKVEIVFLGERRTAHLSSRLHDRTWRYGIEVGFPNMKAGEMSANPTMSIRSRAHHQSARFAVSEPSCSDFSADRADSFEGAAFGVSLAGTRVVLRSKMSTQPPRASIFASVIAVTLREDAS